MPAGCRTACRWRWCPIGISAADLAASWARWVSWTPCPPPRRTSSPRSATPRLGLDPCALSAMPLVAMPLVAVNQKAGGNHGASNAGPRRVPRRRSRARHRPVRPTSAGHQRAASVAPNLGAARSMEGPAAAEPLERSARAGAQSIQTNSRATQVTGAPLAWPIAGFCRKHPLE